jgi:hypothetical protein
VYAGRALLRLFVTAVAVATIGCAASARPARSAGAVGGVHVVAASKIVPVGSSRDAKISGAPKAETGPELPRGGRELFPRYRLVGFCGTPGGPALGALTGNLAKPLRALGKLAAQYGGDREVLPVLELIAVVVMGAPGPDKAWRRRVPDSVVEEYLKAARASKALLLLDIQPGHSDFLTEVKAFERWLKEPDVGVALDPEWAMWRPKQKPGSVYGQTSGEVINDVAAYLAKLVRDNHLPEKALVFHQVNGLVLKDEQALEAHPGVALIKSVDGLGYAGAKVTTYHYLVKAMASFVHPGFKLFFDEDVRYGKRLMRPKEVMHLSPVPEYVLYE